MKLHYTVRGDGPPVLILHGLFGSHQNWLPVARELGGAFRVFLVDLRNHGQSPHHPESTYELMAGDVRRLIEELGVGPVHLVGHSLGGKVSMQLALTAPALVKRIVVVDIAPRAYDSLHDPVFAALRQLDLATVRSRQQADAWLAGVLPNRSHRHFLLTNLVRTADGNWRWRINLEALHAQRQHLVEAIAGNPFHGPALFLHGEHSGYVQPDDAALIRRLFPRATIEPVAGAGHWVHVDAPGPVVERLRAFLDAPSRE